MLSATPGPAMKANQVVIVMDRAEAEETADALGFAQGNGYDSPANGSAQMVMAAALDRDPYELVEQIARTLDPSAFDEWAMTDGGFPMVMKRTAATDQARSVLAVLGEEGDARDE